MSNYIKKAVVKLLQQVGNSETPDTTTVTVLEKDANGDVLFATGTTVPPDAESGYAKGCTFIDTDVAGGTSGTYTNVGTNTSCNFDVVGAAAGDIEGVTAGQGQVGGGAYGTVTMNNGVEIYNDTGGTLSAGTLVAISSYDTTNGITVVKANPAVGIVATHVVDTDIADTTTGNVYPVATVTGIDTSSRTIGDAVYLDNASPGDYAYAPPSEANQLTQFVGVVKVVDASVGEIEFFPGTRNIQVIADLVKDTNGSATKFIKKSALVVYDFANDGGTAGTISLTDTETIPDNAVVSVDSYEVVTTLTSATDAATVALTLPTDGNLFAPVAISDAVNPWDQGVVVNGLGALIAPTPKKTTGARTLELTVAGGENLTAGKVIFQLSYWISV